MVRNLTILYGILDNLIGETWYNLETSNLKMEIDGFDKRWKVNYNIPSHKIQDYTPFGLTKHRFHDRHESMA